MFSPLFPFSGWKPIGPSEAISHLHKGPERLGNCSWGQSTQGAEGRALCLCKEGGIWKDPSLLTYRFGLMAHTGAVCLLYSVS